MTHKCKASVRSSAQGDRQGVVKFTTSCAYMYIYMYMCMYMYILYVHVHIVCTCTGRVCIPSLMPYIAAMPQFPCNAEYNAGIICQCLNCWLPMTSTISCGPQLIVDVFGSQHSKKWSGTLGSAVLHGSDQPHTQCTGNKIKTYRKSP